MSLPGTNDESTSPCVDRSAFLIPWVANHVKKAQDRLAAHDLQGEDLLEQIAELNMARDALVRMTGSRTETEGTQM
jgi:hypothetical protein